MLWDKANHFLAFTLGGWLAAAALRLSRPASPTPVALIAAVVLIAAFGVVDETVQEYTPGRSGGDLYDWIADALGATAGALLTLPTLRRISRR